MTRAPWACFAAIFMADFLVRAAYLSAKYPALTVFADEIGASEMLLGAIVSVSVITGVFAKPLIGYLSDRIGVHAWLLAGTALFALTPPLYLLVDDSGSLVVLRLFHGLATAIYGPVTLAFIASIDDAPMAERFGWFSLARQGAAISAPLIGGYLLAVAPAQHVMAATSLIAICAFAPVVYALRNSNPAPQPHKHAPGLLPTLIALSKQRQIAVFGVIELTSRVGVYATKAFLPLSIMRNGGSALEAGAFLAAQEAAAALCRPIGGRIADRTGAPVAVAIGGLITLSCALLFLPFALNIGGPWIVAALIGIGQGLYEPAALALIAKAAKHRNYGIAFGAVGALRNLGKILGPVLGGVLIYLTSIEQAFAILAAVPAASACLLLAQRHGLALSQQPATLADAAHVSDPEMR